MKKVNVVSPTSTQSRKAPKVKGGRVKKKVNPKKAIGGPGSTPFHLDSSKIRKALANGAEEFSVSKKKSAHAKSKPESEPLGTPTTDGDKKAAKKIIIPARNDADSPPNVESGTQEVKQSRKGRRARKKSKSVMSDTNVSKKVASAQNDSLRSPLLIQTNVINALRALRKNIESRQSKQPKIVNEPTPFLLTVEFFKLPKPTQIHSRALLPHSVVTDQNDVCFFVRDPKKKKNEADDDDSWEDEVRESLNKHGIDNISEIWPWRKFIKMNTQFEEKKKFADRFDFILADSVISYRWMSILNKSIFKNKYPIPVRFSPNNPKLKNEFCKALRKIQVNVEGKGLTSCCTFGHDGLTDNQLAENLNALCLFLSDGERYAGGSANIRSLHVKSARSESFPIYFSMASPNEVDVPVKVSKSKSKPVVGELPTLYNGNEVKVYPDGRVYQVKRLKAVREVENNSSPVKKARISLKTEVGDESDDDNLEDGFIEQHVKEENSDVDQDSSEEEDKVEEVEREYLTELRKMQEKVKKKSKKQKTTSSALRSAPSDSPKNNLPPAKRQKNKKYPSSVDGKIKKPSASPSTKAKFTGEKSSAVKEKRPKLPHKAGRKK